MYLKNFKTSEFRGIIFILGVLVFGLFFSISSNLHSEDTGCKYFKNYGYRDYEHQPQNWGIVQAKNGIIYVANQGGVLEFDGVSWRVIKVPDYNTVRSLAIDKKGTIYIGGQDKIGYLEPDTNGSLEYKSLLDHLDESKKNFGNVWNTHATKEGIYFRTTKFLFRWDSRQIKVWEPDNRIYGSYSCNGELLFFQAKVGLTKMVSDLPLSIPGGKEFAATKKVFMIVPYDSRRLLIGTRPQGFFIHDGKTMAPFPTGADDYLNEKQVYHGIRLSSGDFALATLHGGLVIMSPKGRLKYIFDKTSGLQDENIKYVFEDIQGNLWLALNNGISRIEYKSPFFLYPDLPGLVQSVVRHHNALYAGTSQGLFVLSSQSKTFHPVTGMSGNCWSLLSSEDSILAATSQGVFQVKKNFKRKVIKDQSFVLLPSQHYSGRTWCGTNSGLVVLTQKPAALPDQWMEELRYKTINQNIRSIAEEKSGNLWLVTSTGRVLRVEFPVDIHQPVVTRYDISGGRVYYNAVAAGHVMFAAETGIIRYDENKKSFIPDQTIGDEFSDGSKPVFRILEDKNKHIWLHSQSRNFQAIPGLKGAFTINYKPFRRIPDTNQVNAIYPDPDKKTIWFAGNDGLIRYDTRTKKNYRLDFSTLIRRVFVNGNLIFDGNRYKTDSTPKRFIPMINYKERKNFHFEFAAPFFEAETETQYRFFLEGHDEHWSDWQSESTKDFTTLDAGLYTFRVQAKNVYEHEGKEAEFRFRILPPWYITWWAFLFYGIVFILVMFFIVKWRSGKLEREKQRLEQIVKERTKELEERTIEIQEKNQQLETQTIQLKEQSEKLKDMDQVKSRFFANISHEFRTPLTLIMGPLEQMFSDTRDQKQKEKLKVMLRNSQRLLTLINQLLDLSRFDSGKMKLQAAYQNIVPFLKGLLASFQILAQQNKLNLEFHCEKEDISIYFNADKMEEMMVNLLINAVKFTPAGGKISVSVSRFRRDHYKEGRFPREFVNISVCDTGIGIPKEQLAHIFDRFYQTGSIGEKGRKGTGIGLALTKEIVIMHHGKIEVHSQAGKGTEFVILLPMGHEHLNPDEIIASPETSSNNKKAGDVETLYMIEEGVEIETNTAHEDNTEEQGKNVILVVEDHVDVRKYIREPLESLYTVVEAGDGKEGIEKAKEIIPDLIVSDIMMPEVDGYELCRELKKDIRTSHIPTILLTAKASEESIIQGLETGADDYITKPFNTKILMTRIKNLIDLRRQLQEKIQKLMLLQPAEILISSVDQEFIKELQEIIEKNLSDPGFHVGELSKKLYMNRATLYRKIMALTGESPTEFIRSYRLKRAAQLLRDNFGNVSQVSMEVGFTNMAYFAKCFKEKFHQLPSTYQTSESSTRTILATEDTESKEWPSK
jgi:signal transduction histidine kinase/DNA-binding response OmpR family regulator